MCSLAPPPPKFSYFSWMLRKWPDKFAFLYLSSFKLGGASVWDRFRLRSIISADGGKAYKKPPVLWWGDWKPPIMLQIVIHRASKDSLFKTLFLATAAFTGGLWHYRFFSGLESFFGFVCFFWPSHFWDFIFEVCPRPLFTALQIWLCNSEVSSSAVISSTALSRSTKYMQFIYYADKMSLFSNIWRGSGLTCLILHKTYSTSEKEGFIKPEFWSFGFLWNLARPSCQPPVHGVFSPSYSISIDSFLTD